MSKSKKTVKFYLITLCMFSFACIMTIFIWMLLFTPLLKISLNKEEAYIPDVVGMHIDQATNLLKGEGFIVEIDSIDYQKGSTPLTVFGIYPRAYTKVNKNRPLELSIYKNKEIVKLSNYIGLTLKEAKKQIKLDKFTLNERDIFYYYDDLDLPNLISRQYPYASDRIIEGSDISLWICNGKPPNAYIVPNVIGMDINEAMKELKISGFLIGDISYIIKNDYLENTVYEISYISSDGYNIEILEGVKYTVPITINITITKYEE